MITKAKNECFLNLGREKKTQTSVKILLTIKAATNMFKW